MNIIIATINHEHFLDQSDRIRFEKDVKKRGINRVFYISKAHKLIELLEERKDEENILISNFPPNSSYNNDKVYDTYEDENFIYRSLPADSYLMTFEYYNNIGSKYGLTGVNFITGAPKSIVSLDCLNEIVSCVHVNAFYRSDYFKSNIPSSISIYRYMIQSVKDLMASQPIE
ncbi:hypothetical protein ACXR6G_18335 [Ancylomarina sp. YFZ004]